MFPHVHGLVGVRMIVADTNASCDPGTLAATDPKRLAACPIVVLSRGCANYRREVHARFGPVKAALDFQGRVSKYLVSSTQYLDKEQAALVAAGSSKYLGSDQQLLPPARRAALLSIRLG